MLFQNLRTDVGFTSSITFRRLQMIWRYTKHQIKVFLHSKKLWIVSIMFIIFFPLYYSYFQTVDPDTVYSQKNKEKKLLLMTLDILPHDINDTDKGSEIYDNLTEQLSLINMQIYYVSEGDEIEEYVSDGIRLNKLRLELHDKGNPYVPDYFVIPKKDIKDENKFLQYLEDNYLNIEDNPYYMTHYLASAFDFISGSLLFIMILLFGSNMFAYEHVQLTQHLIFYRPHLYVGRYENQHLLQIQPPICYIVFSMFLILYFLFLLIVLIHNKKVSDFHQLVVPNQQLYLWQLNLSIVLESILINVLQI